MDNIFSMLLNHAISKFINIRIAQILGKNNFTFFAEKMGYSLILPMN
jgi:hypothetical protein